jgi:hypothetical protein
MLLVLNLILTLGFSLGGVSCARAYAQAVTPKPLNSSMIEFVYGAFHRGRPAKYLNCQWKVQTEHGPRSFSTGLAKILTLRVSIKTSLSMLGEDLRISSGFTTNSESLQEEYDDPIYGRVERITLLAADPKHHYLVFEHDGQGTITKVEIGNVHRHVQCLGHDLSELRASSRH